METAEMKLLRPLHTLLSLVKSRYLQSNENTSNSETIDKYLNNWHSDYTKNRLPQRLLNYRLIYYYYYYYYYYYFIGQ